MADPQSMGDLFKVTPPPILSRPVLLKEESKPKAEVPVVPSPLPPLPSMPGELKVERALEMPRLAPAWLNPPIPQPAPPMMPMQPVQMQAHELTQATTMKTPIKLEDEWWTAKNAMTISTVVLLWGAIILSTAAYLIKSGRAADSVLRLFGTILIIVGAIFLVVAGYSDKQIAPVMGLLGTIVGYLLGKDTKEVPKA